MSVFLYTDLKMLRGFFYLHLRHYSNVKNALFQEYILVLLLGKGSIFLRDDRVVQEKTELFIVLGIHLIPGA